ncbi:hypothetical protein NKI56_35420 [Mesorhizobium sp. M0622]|uniref:hypothetical protein n=1 Tax=unclassified Mesorhizobium TaxID=325217 RepID=UPI003337A56C
MAIEKEVAAGPCVACRRDHSAAEGETITCCKENAWPSRSNWRLIGAAMQDRGDGAHSIRPELAYLRLAIVNVVYFGVPGCGGHNWC